MSRGPHGILVIDKPPGLTSHDVVDRVRRILNTNQVGHTGTLDPMATGVLAILVGDATKLSSYLMEGQKTYEAVIRLGVTTDTLDREGQILRTVDVPDLSGPFLERIKASVSDLTGVLQLKVPAFSAVKSKGKKLYELAREGAPVPEIMKEMTFRTVDFLGPRDGRETPADSAGMGSGQDISVRLETSKGAYIRAWADALGEKLGVGACLQELRRTASLPYRIQEAITLQALETANLERPFFIPVADALSDWPLLLVDQRGEVSIQHGQIPGPLAPLLIRLRHDQGVAGVRLVSESNGRLLSILVPHPHQFGFKIGRVFPQ